MSSASAFGNWLALNREARLTGPEEIINDAVENTYFIGEMMMNREYRDVVRAGTHISERVRLGNQGSFRFYQPGDPRNPSRRQTIRTIQFGWRFGENDIPWTNAEMDLAEGDEFTVFKRFESSVQQDLKTDHFNGMEEALWAQPNADLMESVTVQRGRPHSVFSFISENTTDFHPPGYTTVAGLDPATYEYWRNPVSTFDHTDPGARGTGLFSAFDNLFIRMEFRPPPRAGRYFENDDLRKIKICSNLDGVNLFQGLLREGNDHWRAGPQDPSYDAPQWKGKPLHYVSRLDTEPLDEVSGAYTNQPWPSGKPRFVVINCKYTYTVYHPKYFMKTVGPIQGGISQWDTEAMFLVSWYNLVCRSRRRNGIIRPINP